MMVGISGSLAATVNRLSTLVDIEDVVVKSRSVEVEVEAAMV